LWEGKASNIKKRVATVMNDPLGLGENIIKCGVNVTVVYLRY
jgi:hypothetical protein